MGQPFLDLQQLLMYGFAGLVVVLCIGVIARAIFVPSDIRRACCCGGCGFAIADTSTNRCPECGGQLSKVGISTPAMAVRLRGGLGWALLAWTTACAMVAQLAWGYILQSAWASAMVVNAASFGGPQQHSYETSYTPSRYTISGEGMAESSAADLNFRIDASTTFVIDGAAIESGTATLSLRKNGSSEASTLELDLGEGVFELRDGKNAVSRSGKAAEVDAGLVRAWFDAAGIAGDGGAFARSMADAKRLVEGRFADPEGLSAIFQPFGMTVAGSLQSNGGSSSSGPVGGFAMAGPGTPELWTTRTGVIAAVLGSGYLAGVVAISRRHRRLLNG